MFFDKNLSLKEGTMTKEEIKMPYEKYRRANDFIFISGQLPVDPKTDQLSGSTIEEQTKQVMANITDILKGLELTFDHIVKATCFLADIEHFATFNQVYQEYFGERFPARSAFHVGALPKGALIEIELILMEES